MISLKTFDHLATVERLNSKIYNMSTILVFPRVGMPFPIDISSKAYRYYEYDDPAYRHEIKYNHREQYKIMTAGSLKVAAMVSRRNRGQQGTRRSYVE